MKTCAICSVEKPDSAFGKNRRQCKSCISKAQVVRQQNDPTYKERHRRSVLWHRYRVTPEWYDEQLARQGGGCATCPAKTPGDGPRQYFSVDHDHACCPGPRSCGKCVRGLLCMGCNTGLGWLDTNMERVLAYIEDSKKNYLYSGRTAIADSRP